LGPVGAVEPSAASGRQPVTEPLGGLSYVLPVRRWRYEPDPELVGYLRWLGSRVEVIVVDGSDPAVFRAHGATFGTMVRHLPVDPDLKGRYGKVNGVVTGLRAASNDRVIIADDDVRYDDDGLSRMAALLDRAELVRPQNYFDPLPWHARWDTARTLINRAVAADYPGTLGVRRSLVLAAGGYDGDSLFENLELIRTVEAMGGRVRSPLDLYVRRLPPAARHFWSQRVRQAYDDFALPTRLAVELAVAPTVAVLAARRRPGPLAIGLVVSLALAEAGRRRARGRAVFPASCTLFAPLWVAERALCIWLAVWHRVVHGGVPYAGVVLAKAANSRRAIQRRLAGAA
jgi:hypothetical protein